MNKGYIRQVIQKALFGAYKVTGNKDYLKIYESWKANLRKITITGINTAEESEIQRETERYVKNSKNQIRY